MAIMFRYVSMIVVGIALMPIVLHIVPAGMILPLAFVLLVGRLKDRGYPSETEWVDEIETFANTKAV